MTRRRRRATVIVEHDEGFLIVSHSRHQPPIYMLPGGGIKRGEQAICAAVRELYEETGLHTLEVKYLFDQPSDHCIHKVFLTKEIHGTLRKRQETTHIRYYTPEKSQRYHLAWHVKPIIERYLISNED